MFGLSDVATYLENILPFISNAFPHKTILDLRVQWELLYMKGTPMDVLRCVLLFTCNGCREQLF